MKNLSKVVLSSLILILAGCGAASPKRSSPQEVLGTAEQRADHSLTVAPPTLDILFVVDNSWSMKVHQERLAQNIQNFVDEFTQKATIDYHIGVLTIWDSDPVHSQMILDEGHPLGQLIPLQVPKDQSVENLKNPESFKGDREALMIDGAMPPRFVTRETNFASTILKSTLYLGEERGPEYEEMFSPVEAFFTPANLNGPNAGFFRPDAHLLIVFISDANDGSMDVSSSTLYADLLAAKGGHRENLQIYAIISPVGESCHKDQAGAPYKFNELITLAGGKILSLCSDFGATLASYGRDFSAQVSRQVIQLKQLPDFNKPFEVYFGSQLVPKASAGNLDEGWSFDPTHKQVIIGANVKLNPEPGAQMKLNFTPIELSHLKGTKLMTPPQDPPKAVPVQVPVAPKS